jgi:hypothetical protein
MTRHIVTASNDSSSPPSTIHIACDAETSGVPMLQHGSLDFPLDDAALTFLAGLLREHGYGVRPGPVSP